METRGAARRSGSEARRTSLIVAAALASAVIAAVVMVGGALDYLRSNHTSRPAAASGLVTAATRLIAGRGAVVFADDFQDPQSGWNSAVLPSGTRFAYALGGYLVAGKGTLHHFAEAPFRTSLPQLGMSITATQTTGAPAGAGFGVTCWRGVGADRMRYEFVLLAPGTWYIERDGGVDTLTSRGIVLQKGTAAVGPGASPITIVGMCATLDGKSTRLALFINGSKMVDEIDTPGGPATGGWLSALDVSSRDAGDSAVTVRQFEDRDLSS
jgi:hypothetical protein